MDRLRSKLPFLNTSEGSNPYKYESVFNAEMLGASSPMNTPRMDDLELNLFELGEESEDEESRSQQKQRLVGDGKSSDTRKNDTKADDSNISSSRNSTSNRSIITSSSTHRNSTNHSRSSSINRPLDFSQEQSSPETFFKVSFFSRQFRQHMYDILKQFCLIYSLMLILIIGIGSIFNGTLFHRPKYLHDAITIDVVNLDSSVNVINPLIGMSLEFITKNSEELNQKVQFSYQTKDDIMSGNMTIQQALEQRIKRKQSWAYIHVAENSSYLLYEDLKRPPVDLHSARFKADSAISMYYETSRDPKIIMTFIRPLLMNIENMYQESFSSSVMMPMITEWLNDTEQINVFQNHKAIIFQNLKFSYVDTHPFKDPVYVAQTSVGFVMMIIVSFFQFHFFMPIHTIVAAKIQSRHYILYRMISSQLSYCLISFAFTVLFHIFSSQSRFFIIYWFVTYLTISAVGGMNENMALVLFSTYSPLVGFWLLFWVILNISPSFNLIETLPLFYRYGYAVPIYNYLGCINVLVLDSWNEALGRNVAVLVAWVVFNNIMFPLAIKFFSYRMALRSSE